MFSYYAVSFVLLAIAILVNPKNIAAMETTQRKEATESRFIDFLFSGKTLDGKSDEVYGLTEREVGCSEHSDCESGRCWAGGYPWSECTDKKPNGSFCNEDVDCDSGNCAWELTPRGAPFLVCRD
eukprot:CAMPEP_0172511818 /NCGR_PEP_ID=MMETSP1066-20121228/239485_1 /TAXON_ID=671091 /ORGANISM="Coscinodiscus wailesii, Strain CCMP2513" /LENGTH=124 /DNA_ID=CAMNT_0013291369 /DNA_START=62 /DNA_END=436 /DNA_ORIENTATION=+